MTTLLDDFLSGDRSRGMPAVWETIHSRDLDPLVAALPRLRLAAAQLGRV
ncbi:hypothetical protein LJR186_001998 [Microbacterium foliorum]